jgi:hypothetical protein
METIKTILIWALALSGYAYASNLEFEDQCRADPQCEVSK